MLLGFGKYLSLINTLGDPADAYLKVGLTQWLPGEEAGMLMKSVNGMDSFGSETCRSQTDLRKAGT